MPLPQLTRLIGGLLKAPDESGSVGQMIPELVNLYKDELESIIKKPGLSLYNNLATSARVDGLYYWIDQNIIVAVSGNKVFKIQVSDGTYVDVTGDAPQGNSSATFALIGSILVIATGGRMVKLGLTGNTAYIADTDAPVNVSHVATLDTYLIANKVGTNQFYFSAPGNVESWNALDFASAESSPDIIIALIVYESNLYLFGSETTEVWYNDGVSPFSRITSLTMENGCSAAGSVCKAGGSLWWLDTEKRLNKMTGRQPQIVSSEVQNRLTRVTTFGDAKATPLVFDNRSVILLTFPTSNFTLCYDYMSNKWCEWGEWDDAGQVYKSDRVFSAINLTTANPLARLANPTKYSGTIIDSAAVGTLTWTNPTNAQSASDAVNATITFTAASQITHYLNCQNYSVTLPTGVYIVGVEIIADVKTSIGGGSGGVGYGEHIYGDGQAGIGTFMGTVIDSSIRLIKGGVVSGDNKARSQSIGSGGRISWGASNDLWGLTWLPAEVNASNFGAVISFTCSAYSYTGGAGEVQPHIWIDSVAIIIYYRSSQVDTSVIFATIVGDKSNGKLYLLSSDNVKDDTAAIRCLVRSGIQNYKTHKFKRADRLSLRFKPNVANIYEPNPIIKIRWRDEFSDTWSAFTEIPIGTINNAFISGLGMYRGRQYELVYNEPTKFILNEWEEEIELMLR